MQNKVQNPLFAPNKLVAVIFYILMTFLGSTLIIFIIALIYCASHGIPFDEMVNALTQSSPDKVESSLQKGYLTINAIGNMLSYLIMLAVVGFYMRDMVKKDTLEWKGKYRFYLCLLPLCAGIFYGISYGIDYWISHYVHSSENQILIEGLINGGGAVYMFFAVVICAPIVEELIYRKAIFSYLEKKPIAISYIVSIVLFVLPHMLTTSFQQPLDWFLISIPYVVSALMLCVTYHVSGKNVYASWFVHMINNLVSFILICL